MRAVWIVEAVTGGLRWLARRLGRDSQLPSHVRRGRRGEEAAYFYLRRQGYVIVARNWRVRGFKGEVDLIGWDGAVLCFVEVKTRAQKNVVPAEMAVGYGKQRALRGMARLYLEKAKLHPHTRFDVVSVYLPQETPQSVELLKDAFGWRGGGRRMSGR